MIKINLGCGKDYKKGWINVDFNKEIKADKYVDLSKKLPFKNNFADLILLDNVLEHIPKEKNIQFLENLHQICKKEGIINILVPHYSGMYAFKHPTHFNYFGIASFDTFRPEPCFNGERYSKVRFKLLKEKLLFFHHKLVKFPFLSKLPINWLFNFNRTWQFIMERFQFLGFDEIYFQLKVIK